MFFLNALSWSRITFFTISDLFEIFLFIIILLLLERVRLLDALVFVVLVVAAEVLAIKRDVFFCYHSRSAACKFKFSTEVRGW